MKTTISSERAISALLVELQEYFPDSIPINKDVDILEIRRLQGHQEVIQFINNLVDDGEDGQDTEG